MMRFGSLFSGIGGFDLGLERAGMACIWQVEIDPFCRRVLAKHWPHVERYEDVRHVGKHNLRSVDLICGGFPCQPHSVAGKRRGAEDDRDLWPEMRRVVDELRPRWICAENVVGIRTTILDTVLLDLENLGYTARAVVIPAAGVGAPHRRDRIWILAHATSSERDTRAKVAGELFQSAYHITRSNNADRSSADVADTDSGGFQPPGVCSKQSGRTKIVSAGETVSDTHVARLAQRESEPGNDGQELTPTVGANWWSTEPNVGRVAYGVSNRVDRLRALGNAVVPQVVELIGLAIIKADLDDIIREVGE